MLKGVIIDGSAVSRDLLSSVLINGGYDIVGGTNTGAKGMLLLAKFQPHFICIDMHQMDDGVGLLDAIRNEYPKTLIFIVSSGIDASALQDVLARGIHGLILKPFNSGKVLTTIRNAIIALVKKQQQQPKDEA